MSRLGDPLIWAVCTGVFLTAGVACVIAALIPRTARLSDVFTILDGRSMAERDAAVTAQALAPDADWDARLGQFGYTRLRVPVAGRSRRQLALAGRTVADFVAQKLLLGIVGFVLPQVYLLVRMLVGGGFTAIPLVTSMAGLVLGFFWPDLALRRARNEHLDDARASVLSFFDLVTLERLANQSAISSLQAAANMSDALVFTRVRAALERARLEQRAPWRDLEHLADDLQLPELRDLTDVLRLDEQGAALADALRARVKELRDAQLTREKLAAQAVSESMTLYMVIPSFVTGILLMAPPLLRMTGAG